MLYTKKWWKWLFMGILTMVVVMMTMMIYYCATCKCSAYCHFKFDRNEHGSLVSEYWTLLYLNCVSLCLCVCHIVSVSVCENRLPSLVLTLATAPPPRHYRCGLRTRGFVLEELLSLLSIYVIICWNAVNLSVTNDAFVPENLQFNLHSWLCAHF